MSTFSKSADALILEALARIEHKLDVIIEHSSPLLVTDTSMQGSRFCPICGKSVTYNLDFVNGVVTRKCGCSTGMSPLKFEPPIEDKKDAKNRSDADSD